MFVTLQFVCVVVGSVADAGNRFLRRAVRLLTRERRHPEYYRHQSNVACFPTVAMMSWAR